jgi:hypothetical protein
MNKNKIKPLTVSLKLAPARNLSLIVFAFNCDVESTMLEKNSTFNFNHKLDVMLLAVVNHKYLNESATYSDYHILRKNQSSATPVLRIINVYADSSYTASYNEKYAAQMQTQNG